MKKSERLKSRKTISRLFREGRSIRAYPLKLVFLPTGIPEENTTPALFACTVPRRSFPRAVDRNRIKRQIRESFRLNRHKLYEKNGAEETQYALMFIYIAKECLSYQKINAGMQKIIDRFDTKKH